MKFSFNEGKNFPAKVIFESDPLTGGFSQRTVFYTKKESQVKVLDRTRNCDIKVTQSSILLSFKFNKRLPLLQMQQILLEQIDEIFDKLSNNKKLLS